MRNLTQTETERLRYLAQHGIEVALIEPTATGLHKSIMDATQPVRTYLKAKRIHDYSAQSQGPVHKAMIPTSVMLEDTIYMTHTSLYRPATKLGDPRLWIYGIQKFTEANDILAIVAEENNLIVLNLTRQDVISMGSVAGPLRDFIESYERTENRVADELLQKLRNIAAKGYIRSTLDADTAIGRLLESELGIPINSHRAPDYKGIELKSFRSKRTNRKNLFAQVPNWEISKFKSSLEILNTFGYERGHEKKLYCTVGTKTFNSQGLRFRLDANKGLLAEYSSNAEIGDFVYWKTEDLRERLLQKHAETFWVEADVKRDNGALWFKFTKVEHTKGPLAAQLETLIDGGYITMDHLIKSKGSSAIEKGPLFKLRHDSLSLLFPPSNLHVL